jgi:sugar phosphate isomerase/epimerase
MRDLSTDRNLEYFSLNTGTVRAQGDFLAILEAAKRHGISRVSPWREQIAAIGLDRAVRALRDGGFRLSGYCRGGLFPTDADHVQAVRDDNHRAVDEALALGAPCLVIVAGGLPQFTHEGSAPSRDIAVSRAAIREGLAELLDYAQAGGMPLALEPLHPMMAAQRCAVNTLRQALDLCDELDPDRSRRLGVTVDAYHVWWDFEVHEQIRRIGRDRMLSFHVCDWLAPTVNLLQGRGMMGDGIIEIAKLRESVEAQRPDISCEVEVLSSVWAERPIDEVMSIAIERYRTVC